MTTATLESAAIVDYDTGGGIQDSLRPVVRDSAAA